MTGERCPECNPHPPHEGWCNARPAADPCGCYYETLRTNVGSRRRIGIEGAAGLMAVGCGLLALAGFLVVCAAAGYMVGRLIIEVTT